MASLTAQSGISSKDFKAGYACALIGKIGSLALTTGSRTIKFIFNHPKTTFLLCCIPASFVPSSLVAIGVLIGGGSLLTASVVVLAGATLSLVGGAVALLAYRVLKATSGTIIDAGLTTLKNIDLNELLQGLIPPQT